MAYAILRTNPGLTPKEFADRLEISALEAEDVLGQLVDLALVRRHPESGRLSVLATPLTAMREMIRFERAALDARRRSLNERYDLLAALMAEPPGLLLPLLPVTGEADDGAPWGAYATAERVEGPVSIGHRLQELADRAGQEVLSFSPPTRGAIAAGPTGRFLEPELLARGVAIRTLYVDTVVSEPQALAYATDLVAAGGQVRLVPSLPIRLTIVDRRVAAILIHPQDGRARAIILHDPGTVSGMEALFEAYWRDGRSIPSQVGADASASDIVILRLLASGAKDEAVARQVGVSVRTVRRAIARLMERLHVDSRFELAVRAVNRGLLD